MRPDRSRLAALALAVLAALLAPMAAPTPARADVCDKVPSIPGVPNPVKTGCKVASKGPGAVAHPEKAVTDIATAPIRAAGDQVMQGVTKWVADGAGWLVGQAGKLIGDTTRPRLDSPWFRDQYRAMAALAAVFALPLLLLSVLQGVMRRDGSIVTRAAFVQLPAACLLTAGAVTVVALFLGLTDEMSAQVASSAGSDATEFFKDTGSAIAKLTAATGPSPAPLFAVFLGGLIAAVGAFFVWVELVIRSAAIYVTVLFLPFTFVAMVWPATARWCRRLVELVFAIVFSKFVIVAIMALAAAGLGHSRSDDAFQGVMAGAALMLLAAFSPLALLRLIPLAESAAHTNWRSGAGSQTLGPIAGPAAVMRRVTDANWGARAGGGLRVAPAAAAVGAGGPAAAGAAIAGGRAPRSDHRQGGEGSGSGSARDEVRYAAVGGGGQAARPSPSPAPGSSDQRRAQGRDISSPAAAGADESDRAQRPSGGPAPMAAPRDLSGSDRDRGGRDAR